MFVNMRADYRAYPLYYFSCIGALFLSFLIAYDIYIPPMPQPQATQSEGGSWSEVDFTAIIQRGIDAQGTGVIVLETLRDVTLFVRRHAGIANPVVCALLVWKALMGQGDDPQLLSAAPACSKAFLPKHLETPINISLTVICILVIVARRELRPLNIAELEQLKYNYKGA